MKAAPAGLVSLLGTGQFVFCDLYQFTLITGQVLTYTTADVDVVASFNANIFVSNNSFSDAAWIETNATVTANSGTSPDGTNDAWQWQRGSTAAAFTNQAQVITSLTSPVTYKFSICAKPGTGNFLALYLSNQVGDPNAVRACFNVSSGTVSAVAHTGGGTALTNIQSTIESVGNGFYRCSVSATFPAGSTVLSGVFSGRSTSGEIDGTDSLSSTTVLVFNATLETVATFSSSLFFDQSGNKATAHWKTGLDVDTWQVYIMPVEFDPVTGTQFPIKIGNTGWLAAVAAGALSGAQVDIHRTYLPSWPQPWVSPLTTHSDWSGDFTIVDYFAGRVAAVDVMRNQAVVSINSWLDQFQLMMPRNLWQAPCRWTLFDAGCTLSQPAFAVSGSAQPVSNQSQIVTTGLGLPAGWFALGQVTMTSGLNAGFRRMVKSFDGTTMFLIAPFPFAVAIGDTFTAFPGCDKSLLTCTNKFANQLNFGGEDQIPKPETAV